MNKRMKWGILLLACMITIGGYVFYTIGQHRNQAVEIFTDGPAEMRYLRQHAVFNELPSENSTALMDLKELQHVVYGFLNNINYLCRRLLRMGKMKDGGWFLCDDYEFRPMAPCIVYSFGVGFDFSYDEDMARLYQCNVYSFDPSMKTLTYNRSALVHFYNVGIRGKDTDSLPEYTARLAKTEKWDMRTFSQIKAMLGHQKKIIDVVKMDIENSEWHALPDMIHTGQLNQVRQFQIEFHLKNHRNIEFNLTRLRPALRVLRGLEDLGFRPIHSHNNPHKSCIVKTDKGKIKRMTCLELSFVNAKFVRKWPV